MKIGAHVMFFAAGVLAEQDGSRDDGNLVGDEIKNVVMTTIFNAIVDLFQINADCSTAAMEINRASLELWNASINGSYNDPSKVQQVNVSERISRIQSAVGKIVVDKQKYVADAGKLENDVNTLFTNDEMGGLGNYLNIVKLQTETINEMQEEVAELQFAFCDSEPQLINNLQTASCLDSKDVSDFASIDEKLLALEGDLVELMDAIANKIVAMRALLLEFGDEDVPLLPLLYVSSLYRTNVRITIQDIEKMVAQR